MIVLVILHRDVIGVSHFQTLEQLVQRGLMGVVVLSHLTGAQHFHNHREVLLVWRRFMVQIEHQRQKQHGCRCVPKGVLALRAFRRGTFKEVRHKPLHIVIVPEIHEGVITMAALHVQQIQHTHFIPFLLQQIARIPRQLSFRIKNNKAGVRLAEVGHGVKPCFARAAAAHDDGVQIAPVLSAIQPNMDILRKQRIGLWLLCPVFPVHGSGVAPLRRAVFLPSPVVAPGGEVNTQTHSISE